MATTLSNLSVDQLHGLIAEAEQKYWSNNYLGDGEIRRIEFVARYIYDHVHPMAQVVDAIVPEAGYGYGV